MYGRVYLIRNKLSGKLYVGITTSTLKARWGSHGYEARLGARRWLLHRAMAKHGIENFEISLLEECDDRALLHEAEQRWIKEKGSFAPAGYNMTMGGGGVSGFKRSDEFKRQVSNRFKGRVFSDETRKKMCVAKIGYRPSPKAYVALKAYQESHPARSPETRSKMSAALKGRKLSSEHIEKMRLFRTGKRLSAAARAAISRPVTAEGREFGSLSAAATELGVSIATVVRRIEAKWHGYGCAVPKPKRAKRSPEQCEAMRERVSKKVNIGGVEYRSLTEAALAFGVTRQAIGYRIRHGTLNKSRTNRQRHRRNHQRDSIAASA